MRPRAPAVVAADAHLVRRYPDVRIVNRRQLEIMLRVLQLVRRVRQRRKIHPRERRRSENESRPVRFRDDRVTDVRLISGFAWNRVRR